MRRILRPGELRAGLLPRLAFLVVLGGGLLLWAEFRKPRELRVAIDLSAALPGEITAIDVVVRRDGHALARHEAHYGAAGAPGTIEFVVHARPGEAEVETTLAYASGRAQRFISSANLSGDQPATVPVR